MLMKAVFEKVGVSDKDRMTEIVVSVSAKEARGVGYQKAAQQKAVDALFGPGHAFVEYARYRGHGRIWNGQPKTGHLIAYVTPVKNVILSAGSL